MLSLQSRGICPKPPASLVAMITEVGGELSAPMSYPQMSYYDPKNSHVMGAPKLKLLVLQLAKMAEATEEDMSYE